MYQRMAWLASVLLLAACNGGGSDSSGTTTPPTSSSCSQRETELTTALAAAPSEVDFSLGLTRSDGRSFSYNRGSSTLNTSYESASTSKLVSAIIILRQVEQGYLKLTDRPQDRLSNWPISLGDPLYNITLAQLLSFTSGLTSEPLCQNLGGFNFASCVYNIANNNAGNGTVPGTAFYYAGTHLQVAGLMAMRARGVSSWAELFGEFKSQTGLFATASYDLPSSTNPRLAGGMHWSGNEYLAFLKALQAGSLLNSNSMAILLQDRTAGLSVDYSPALESINEDWHYGFGYWHECQGNSFNCNTATTRISSPGTYGAYPFWDRSKGYVGILARQGALGTYAKGLATYRTVAAQVDAWATCQ